MQGSVPKLRNGKSSRQAVRAGCFSGNVRGLAACKDTSKPGIYKTPVPRNTPRKERHKQTCGVRACREEGRGTTPRAPVDGRPAGAGRPRRPPEASGRIPLGNRAAPVISAKRGGYLTTAPDIETRPNKLAPDGNRPAAGAQRPPRHSVEGGDGRRQPRGRTSLRPRA